MHENCRWGNIVVPSTLDLLLSDFISFALCCLPQIAFYVLVDHLSGARAHIVDQVEVCAEFSMLLRYPLHLGRDGGIFIVAEGLG